MLIFLKILGEGELVVGGGGESRGIPGHPPPLNEILAYISEACV